MSFLYQLFTLLLLVSSIISSCSSLNDGILWVCFFPFDFFMDFFGGSRSLLFNVLFVTKLLTPPPPHSDICTSSRSIISNTVTVSIYEQQSWANFMNIGEMSDSTRDGLHTWWAIVSRSRNGKAMVVWSDFLRFMFFVLVGIDFDFDFVEGTMTLSIGDVPIYGFEAAV